MSSLGGPYIKTWANNLKNTYSKTKTGTQTNKVNRNTDKQTKKTGTQKDK